MSNLCLLSRIEESAVDIRAGTAAIGENRQFVERAEIVPRRVNHLAVLKCRLRRFVPSLQQRHHLRGNVFFGTRLFPSRINRLGQLADKENKSSELPSGHFQALE
jgi:hypothetical protein